MRYIAHNFFLNPAFYIFCGMLWGAWGQWKAGRNWLAGLLALATILLMPAPINYLIQQKERSFPIWEEQKLGAPYILVLGAGGTPDPAINSMHQLAGSPLLRVTQGMRIAQELPESILVFSSAGRDGYLSQAEMYANYAKESGMEEARLGIVPTPKTTWEEAQEFVKAYPDAKKIILVTTAVHLPRAKRMFEAHGLEVIPAASDFIIRKHPAGDRLQWIPSLHALQRWETYVHETIGMFLGKF
ncbi:YdcF family protein [Mongoliitalea daihaiensis]|uniref:YdcF family protein n=1 Tax=Mongoliitalea daihaiensis TaxID=2782006 RepID=UPI001F3FA6A5|nr:YdcF family protein [Mongoliitalea daihaiensis]UJP64445.1 YdcF family protein [Mongoliitalea daihaiensis]